MTERLSNILMLLDAAWQENTGIAKKKLVPYGRNVIRNRRFQKEGSEYC